MKNLKKYFALLVVVALMVSSIVVPASAADSFSYTTEAQKLNDLGLYKGISTTEFVPDLGSKLNRETGVVMLLRIFGLDETALKMTDADTTAALKSFKDASQISSWAKKQVAYAVKNNMVVGATTTTFAPKAALNGKAYATLILRKLGYTVDAKAYETAPATLKDKGGLTADEATKFTAAAALIKDDLVGISYGSLKAVDSTGKKVFEVLIANKVITEAQAVAAGVYVIPAAPTALPTPTTPAVLVDVTGVTAVAVTKVEVAFDAAVSVADAVYTNFEVKAGTTPLAVTGIDRSTDGKTLTLTTAKQTTAAAYTLTIKNLPLKDAADATQTFVGAIEDKDAPSAITASATSSKKVTVTFTDASSKLDKASAETAANYTIAGLTVSAASMDGKVVTLTTTAQTAGTVYTVSVKGVKDVAGNEITTALTANFAGKAPDTTAATVGTAAAYSNKKVVVNFTDASEMDEASAETVANYTIAGLTVSAAELVATDADVALYGLGAVKNKSVVLTTTAQTAGTVYTVSVLNVKDAEGNAITTASTSSFAGKAADTTAPTVNLVTAYSNNQILVTFTDASTMDKASAETVANYTIAGLTISAAKLIATTDDQGVYGGTLYKSVLLTTTAQTSGTVYTLSVLNVKDSEGNAITTASTGTFAGKAADTTAPTVSSVGALAGNKVQIVFADASAMNEATVKALTNYSISTLGYPVSVDSYTAATKTLVLNTTAQSNGSVYTITINGVKDASGNAITADTKVTFAGIGTAQDAPAISSVTALNKRQIKVVFNKEVENVGNDDFTLKKGTGSAVGFDTIASTIYAATDMKTYILTIDTTPANALVNDVYTLAMAAATNVSDLGGTTIVYTDTDKATKSFGGITDDVTAPSIAAIEHTSSKVLKVTFANEVKTTDIGLVGDVFVSYDATTIALNSVTAANDAKVDADNKKIVYFTFASAIAGDKVAKLNIKPAAFDNITDVTGNINMVATSGLTNYEKMFGSTTYTATTLKVSSVTAKDDMSLEVLFNQDIQFTDITTDIVDTNFAAITRKDGTSISQGVDYDIKTAFKSGTNKVIVYYKALTTKMAEGYLYDFAINTTGDDSFTTMDGVALNASVADDAKGTFAFNAGENAAPSLVSVIPLSATRLQLTFSEDISGVPTTDGTAATDIEIYNGTTQIAAADLGNATAVNSSKKLFTIDLTGTGAFIAGTTYKVKMPSALTMTDTQLVKGVKESGTDEVKVEFGGIGSLAPTITSALYDESDGTLVITGTGFNAASAGIDETKVTVGGYTLTGASTGARDSATQITITLTGADKTAVDALWTDGAHTDALGVASGWLIDAAKNAAPAEAATGNTVTSQA